MCKHDNMHRKNGTQENSEMETKGTNEQLNNLLNAILILSTLASLICCIYLLSSPKKNLTNRGKVKQKYVNINTKINI